MATENYFCDCAACCVSTKVFSPNCGKLEMLSPEYSYIRDSPRSKIGRLHVLWYSAQFWRMRYDLWFYGMGECNTCTYTDTARETDINVVLRMKIWKGHSGSFDKKDEMQYQLMDSRTREMSNILHHKKKCISIHKVCGDYHVYNQHVM
jgi:hypothetical protein